MIPHLQFQVFHPLLGGRVGEKVGGRIAGSRAGNAPYFLEHGDHGRRIIAGPFHEFQAQVVCFLFVFPAVSQHDRSRGGLGRDSEGGSRLGPQEDPCQQGSQGRQPQLHALLRLPGNMPAHHVPDFMGHDTRQFVFAVHHEDQAAVDKDFAAGNGEGVYVRRIQDVKFIFKRLRPHGGQDSFPDPGDIIPGPGVLHNGPYLLDFLQDFLPQFPFLLGGHGRSRGGAVEERKEENRCQKSRELSEK